MCIVSKLFSYYHKRGNSKDGLAGQCRECKQAIVRDRKEYHRNTAQVIEELTLSELKGLFKEHKIALDGHYNKKDIGELLKQRGVSLQNMS